MAEGGLPTAAPPMGQRNPVEEDEPEVDPIGVINKREATHHRQLISDAVHDFKWQIKEGEIQDVLKQLIEEVQVIIKWVFPTIAEANIITILRAIPDCTCTALRDQSEEHEKYLEEIMPEEDIPEGEKIVADVSQVKPLTYDQKDLIVSLFDNLSIAHEHLGRAAANMSSLCKVMNPDQLLLIMKCSMRPLVQLSASPGLFDTPTHKQWKELPDDKVERVKDTITPRENAKELQQEPHYSPTRLLAATMAPIINKNFGRSVMMSELQWQFIVRPKQLSLCITGRKYMGGSDRKAQLKRRHDSMSGDIQKKREVKWFFYYHIHLADKKSARWVVGSSG